MQSQFRKKFVRFVGDFLNISVSQIPSEYPKTHFPDTCPLTPIP